MCIAKLNESHFVIPFGCWSTPSKSENVSKNRVRWSIFRHVIIIVHTILACLREDKLYTRFRLQGLKETVHLRKISIFELVLNRILA